MIEPLRQIHHLLAQIGFREKESLIYAILLITGPNVVTNIARQIQLPRSTTYNIIIDLTRRGVLQQHHKNNQQIYEATPERLLKYLQNRRIKIDHQIKKLHQTLLQLNEEQKK